jgi:PAS domain S-box-containing protein
MPPLTGLVGLYGSEIARAGLIACQEVNENGGVLGRPLELVIEDDGSLPESAVAAAENLIIRDRCTAIIGNLLSNSRIAVAYRVAEPRKIPYLNFSFYEGSISSRYFFHFAALPNQQIERMIPYMHEKFGPRMFFAGNNYEWPRGSIHAGKAALEEAGGIVVGEEYCPIGVSDTAIDNLLDQVEETAPDVFVPYFAGADQLSLLTRFTERGLKKRMAVVMGHYDEMMASNLSPEVREGFYSSNTYFMTVDTAENRDFLARLEKFPEVTGVWPQGNGILTNFGEGTYICVKAFAEAANLAGSLESEALVDALKTIETLAPQGTVQMNPQFHHARVNTYLSQCGTDGVFSIVKNFGAIDPILPERYRHQVIKQDTTLDEDLRIQTRILELMSEAVFIVSAENKSVVYANGGAERMFGYDTGEMLGLLVTQFCRTPEGAPGTFLDDILSTLAHKGDWQGEIRRNGKDGSDGSCSLSAFAFTHPVHGEVWLFVATDITKRKLVETALKESEERYAFAISGTNDGLWDWNIETNENYMSPRFKEILGYQDSELENNVEVFFNALHPDDVDRVKEEVRAHFEEHVPFNTEYRLRRKGGDYVWVLAKGQATWAGDDKPLRMAGSISDITDKKQIQEVILKAQARLSGILRIAPEAIITIDEEMSIQLFNQGAERIFGYSAKEVLHQPLDILMPERYRGDHASHVKAFEFSGDAYRLMEKRQEIYGLRKDGTEFPAAASVSKLESGGETIYTVMLQDITKRKHTQDALIAAKSVAETSSHAKSQFLAAVSHELRTPLNAILGFSQILKGEYFGPLGDKKYQEYAEDITSSGEHLLSLVDDLLDISTIEAGIQPLEKEKLSTKEIIIECVKIVGGKALNGGINLVTSTTEDMPPLYADLRAIKQILLNLLSNAIKFTHKGGEIVVSAKATENNTTIKVTDTGIGIPAEKLPKLTGMFIRAEDDAYKAEKGWGLGLSITKSLVDLHDGQLDIKSKVDKGTIVTVTLPNSA